MLEKLYRSYYRELYLYIYSLCRDRTMAEDILQETFLKALTSLKDSHTNMRAWLYLVARNLCLNGIKKNQKTVPEEPTAGQASSVDILEEILWAEQMQELTEALATLSSPGKEVLLLQYFGEFSQKEIGAILGLTPGNVLVLAHRAKKELQTKLTKPVQS